VSAASAQAITAPSQHGDRAACAGWRAQPDGENITIADLLKMRSGLVRLHERSRDLAGLCLRVRRNDRSVSKICTSPPSNLGQPGPPLVTNAIQGAHASGHRFGGNHVVDQRGGLPARQVAEDERHVEAVAGAQDTGERQLVEVAEACSPARSARRSDGMRKGRRERIRW
jgi:hypothetical protein